jgi:hypothetical protein
VLAQKTREGVHLRDGRLGSQLAQRMAHVDVLVARDVSDAEPSDQALGDRDRVVADGLGDAVALGLVVQDGADVRAVAHAHVEVQEKPADPVAKLALDSVALVGKHPAGLVGGREGVVGRRKRDLDEAQRTQGLRSQESLAWRGLGERGAVLVAGRRSPRRRPSPPTSSTAAATRTAVRVRPSSDISPPGPPWGRVLRRG